MNFPPPGYDDENVVPQHQLSSLLDQIESELLKIRSVFEVQEFAVPVELEFGQLRASADELGEDYPFLIEHLITDYKHFRDEPNQDKLEQLFSDVKSLQLLLVG